MSFPAPSVRRNLKASMIDGAAFGGMVGIGETYLAAFALAIGVSEVSAGLIASVPMVAGGLLQLISPRAVQKIGSEKRWILVCSTIQALTFASLVVAAMAGTISLVALFCIVAIYWGSGLATGPAWNVWIEAMVPIGVRVRYFAARSRFAQLTTLAGFLLGGGLLALGERWDVEIQSYAVMFLLAGILRLISVYWLAQHQPVTRPASVPADAVHPAFSTVGKGASNGHGSHHARFQGAGLLFFLVLLQGMVQLAGPFFTPFMLKEVGFSYIQFVSLISMGFIAKVVSLSMWGHVTKRYNARTLLWIGAVGVVPMSSLWIVSQHFVWLLLVQVFSGIVWAAYELGFFLMFFEVLPQRRRAKMLTIYNFANTLAIFCGAMAGGWILHAFGASTEGYLAIFGLSSAGRMLALFVLAGTSLKAIPVLEIGVRVLGLRPGSGSVDTPVLPSFDDHLDS
jgi:MFS family permease